jgi:hypothetical protein
VVCGVGRAGGGTALYEFLERHPAALAGQAEVMQELADVGDELEAAQRAGVLFRFAIIM